MRILLVGGGSGGPVAPLLAVANYIQEKHPKARFLLVGTKGGPEARMAEAAGISFTHIPAGKYRRYFSLKNIASPFFTAAGFVKALGILRKFKPDAVFGTGSFVQVPVVWAAFFLRIPVLLHQQDLYPSLANTLCQIAARKITVTFEDSLTDFATGFGFFYHKPNDKIVLTGNPFREDLKYAKREDGLKKFHLHDRLPVLLVLGGGTGAKFINDLVHASLPKLSKVVQVVHSTGKGKGNSKEKYENYQQHEFIPDMGHAYAAADIVVSRAGLSTITELSNLGKISIIVPMPKTHQEVNAYFLSAQHAAIVATQDKLNAEGFVTIVRKLLIDDRLQKEIERNMVKIMPKKSAVKIGDLLLKLAETKSS